MKIGIRCHDLCKGTIDEIINKCHEYGFENLQFVFKKTLQDENGNFIPFSKETAEVISKKLEDAGINIAMLGAYFNPVHSNKELVEKNTVYFEEHLKNASILKCEYVGTETGSYNDDKWTYNPKNQTEEGYQDTMRTFKRLVKVAEENNTTILMEPAWGHVIFSVKQLKRAIDELNSDHVKETIDIYNLLNPNNCLEYKNIFLEACQTFGEDIKIFHLKDFYVEDNKLVQCGLGKGIIDFEYLLSIINKYSSQSTLIFEGVTGEDILPSLQIIKSILRKL